MNKLSKHKIIAIILVIFAMTSNAFANEITVMGAFNATEEQNTLSYEQYIVAAEQLKTQIDGLSNQINDYKKYIEAAKFKLSQIEKDYTETRNLTIPEDKFKQAKELRKTVIIKTIKDESIDDSDTVSQLAKNGQYDKAISKYYAIYDSKVQQFNEYSKAVIIWIQINTLIS